MNSVCFDSIMIEPQHKPGNFCQHGLIMDKYLHKLIINIIVSDDAIVSACTFILSIVLIAYCSVGLGFAS